MWIFVDCVKAMNLRLFSKRRAAGALNMMDSSSASLSGHWQEITEKTIKFLNNLALARKNRVSLQRELMKEYNPIALKSKEIKTNEQSADKLCEKMT